MKRPLPARLREIRDRMDLLGDDEDVATLDEAIKVAEEAERQAAEDAQTELALEPSQPDIGGFRSTDPDTSRKGAVDAYPRTGTHRAVILLAIMRAERGLTWGEVEELTGVPSPWKRISELIEGGWIRPLDETRRVAKSGSEGRVYVATEKAVTTAAATQLAATSAESR